MFLKPGFHSKVDAMQTFDPAAPVLSCPQDFFGGSRFEFRRKSMTAYKG